MAGLANELEYLNPRWTDAHLTQLGWEQTAALKRHLAGLPQPFRVDVVIVSPLTRTLETAAGVFGGGDWTAADGDDLQLMAGQSEEPVGCYAIRELTAGLELWARLLYLPGRPDDGGWACICSYTGAP